MKVMDLLCIPQIFQGYVNAYLCLGNPGQKYGSTDVDSLFRLTGTKVGKSRALHACR